MYSNIDTVLHSLLCCQKLETLNLMIHEEQQISLSDHNIGIVCSNVALSNVYSNLSYTCILTCGAMWSCYRIWWLTMFIVSVATCTYFISATWTKWKENPVVISFSQTQTPIWKIPFPAVTICPLNKIKQSVFNYTDALAQYKTLTGNKHKRFWDLSSICDVIYKLEIKKSSGTTKFVVKGNITTDETIYSTIKTCAPQLDETIIDTFWSGLDIEPDELFAPIITEEGLCFTFNSLGQNDMFSGIVKKDFSINEQNRPNEGWSNEGGYQENIEMTTYPARTANDGAFSGLSLRLRANVNEREYECGTTASGFKVILHNPAEFPRVSQQYILVPGRKQMAISITPNMVTTSDGLKDIPPHIRNCYFTHEKSLLYFKEYTQNNCKIECIANVTKYACHCLPFNLPRDNETVICDYRETCPLVIRRAIFYLQMKYALSSFRYLYAIYERCNCLPACAMLDYSAETSQSDLHRVESELGNTSRQGNDMENWLEITQLNIFFKNTNFQSRYRSELYGQIDFVANCGGLLGLFMGFSFLSLVEIVYFLTIRSWIIVRKSNNAIDVNA